MVSKSIIRGEILENPEFSFMTKANEYYSIKVGTKRKSGVIDTIPVIVPRNIIDPNADYKGLRIMLEGQVQTRRENKHLCLFIFTKNIQIYDTFDEEDINEINIQGLLKNKIIRKTFSNQDIAEIYILNKCYYYPCIAWNNNVEKFSNMKYNKKVNIIGRFQSREKDNLGNKVYEISIQKIK